MLMQQLLLELEVVINARNKPREKIEQSMVYAPIVLLLAWTTPVKKTVMAVKTMEVEDKSSGAARALEITDRSDIHRNVMATMWFSSGSIATATIMVRKQIGDD
uniref:Uncharacterized protein n=1 Tax=Oryza sativa subsp. japonica TaxID=39947 RepID=Q6YT80_ORYSJ|nr:hypothetical protein [Oryza sativa Japonica Group]BAD31388.1 hypothetical protein [Oryza sativa Japonica Group]